MQSPLRALARNTRLASGVTGILVATLVAIVAGVFALPSTPASAESGSAITVTAASQDTDLAHAPLPNLAVTVSQTQGLVSQGLAISWTGGIHSSQPSSENGGENFLQVMQCWGDDPSVAAGQPAQPDRTTCQYGGFHSAGASRDNFVTKTGYAPQDAQYTAPGTNFANPTYTSIPFRAPAGDPVASVVDNKKVENVDVNTNQYFTSYTTNEVKWAGSGTDGSGAIKFEVQTAQQSAGLDCGSVIKAADNTTTGKSCWLVIVPRGTADAGELHIIHSGLFYESWKHRIAVRIGFRPIGINCAIGADEQQISGSELIAGAVSSWQPALCASASGSIFTISTGTESDALTAASDPINPAAMALTSRPLDTSSGEVDTTVYAPVAMSGISLAFSIDRQLKTTSDVPQSVLSKSNQPFTSLNLTPRLVAKLLTNSDLDSLPGSKADLGFIDSSHPGHNARTITTDPDFLAVNDPEWSYEALSGAAIADLLVPQGRSDVANQLWRYVVADASAVAFLAGTPDPWGMIVNPWNSTVAATNPSGVGLAVPRDTFPKSDPTELAATSTAGAINLVTWRPYTNDLDTSGYLALRGDGLEVGFWDQTKTPPAYVRAPRSLPGFQRVLGLTSTASAAKYQVISASLLNPAGAFVAPTGLSMAAAAAAMTATVKQPQVYEYDPAGASARAATAAYPLTMPVYAATNPAQNTQAVRDSYAAFIRYAATTGQNAGPLVGQLPEGYAPLTPALTRQALAAATLISAGVKVSAPAKNSTPEAVVDSYPAPASMPFQQFTATPAMPTVDASPSGPAATGVTAASVFGASTPKDPDTGGLASGVPLSLLAGFASAGAVPLLTRFRRKI